MNTVTPIFKTLNTLHCWGGVSFNIWIQMDHCHAGRAFISA